MKLVDTHKKILKIMGFKQWFLIAIDWFAIRCYLEQIWFCHHNARVLADMEWRLGCVLSASTRGMSKSYYTKEAMLAEIYSYQQELCEDAVKNYKDDYGCFCDLKD